MPPRDAKDGSVDEVVLVADLGHRRGQHQDAVDLLYRKARDDKPQNIVPLVMDLAHLSPGQGRAGRERPAFDNRWRLRWPRAGCGSLFRLI